MTNRFFLIFAPKFKFFTKFLLSEDVFNDRKKAGDFLHVGPHPEC